MPDDPKKTDKARAEVAADEVAVAPAPVAADEASPDDELDPAEGIRTAPTGNPQRWPWLRWQGPAYYGGVPTRGSGPDGELTPQEVQAWLGSRPGLYRQAVRADKSYVRIAAPKAKE